MKNKYVLVIYIIILFFLLLNNCLTIGDKEVSEYKKIICPTCGFENAVFFDKEDKGSIVEIQCANCKRTIMVRIN